MRHSVRLVCTWTKGKHFFFFFFWMVAQKCHLIWEQKNLISTHRIHSHSWSHQCFKCSVTLNLLNSGSFGPLESLWVSNLELQTASLATYNQSKKMEWLGVKSWGNTQATGMVEPSSRYNLELHAYLPLFWFRYSIYIKSVPSLNPVQYNGWCSSQFIYCKRKDTALLEKWCCMTTCTSLDPVKRQFPFYEIGIIAALPNSQGHWKDKVLLPYKLLLLEVSNFFPTHSLIVRLVRTSRYEKFKLTGFWRGW